MERKERKRRKNKSKYVLFLNYIFTVLWFKQTLALNKREPLRGLDWNWHRGDLNACTFGTTNRSEMLKYCDCGIYLVVMLTPCTGVGTVGGESVFKTTGARHCPVCDVHLHFERRQRWGGR